MYTDTCRVSGLCSRLGLDFWVPTSHVVTPIVFFPLISQAQYVCHLHDSKNS